MQRILMAVLLAVATSACADPAGTVPSAFVFASVATGGQHTCGIDSHDELFCWGSGERGQIGDGRQRSSGWPVRVALPAPAVQVAAGGAHTCALSAAGALWCWGANDHGQVGLSTTSASQNPMPIGDGITWSTVSAGGGHTCALSGEGQAYCWGRNDHGQLGTGGDADERMPAPVAGAHRFQQIAAGADHTCAIDLDGVVHCWGRNDHGQLGNGTVESVSVPTRATAASAFRTISAGALHSCGIGLDQLGYCWGSNVHGELANGGIQPLGAPGAENPALLITFPPGELSELSAGRHVSCAVGTSLGSLCWGRGREGQLGLGRRVDHSWPQITIFPNFEQIVIVAISSQGDTHTCGIDVIGALFCWGEGTHGQLGIGAGMAVNPARVMGERR